MRPKIENEERRRRRRTIGTIKSARVSQILAGGQVKWSNVCSDRSKSCAQGPDGPPPVSEIGPLHLSPIVLSPWFRYWTCPSGFDHLTEELATIRSGQRSYRKMSARCASKSGKYRTCPQSLSQSVRDNRWQEETAW
jgi:hypothetical protein